MSPRRKLTGAPLRASEKRQSDEPESAASEPEPIRITIALRESAQTHAEEALTALVELVRGASSEHVRVAAANAILDRALGKPLPGAKAADDLASEEDMEEGPLVVRWLDPEKS